MKTSRWTAAFFVGAAILCGCKPAKPAHGLVLLLAVGSSNQVSEISSNDLKRVAEMVGRRVDALGYPVWMKREGSNSFSITVPLSAAKETEALKSIMNKAGLLEFFFVHEESPRLVAEGLTPVGYRLMKETRLRADGSREVIPMLVEKRAVTEPSGRNIKRADVGRGSMNDPRITFQFDEPGTAAFAKLTSDNIGRQLAIVVDGELFSAPFLRSAITEGTAQISGGNLSAKEAQGLTILMRFPLEVPVQIVEERTY
jgi:SecD/SecF fusion protein